MLLVSFALATAPPPGVPPVGLPPHAADLARHRAEGRPAPSSAPPIAPPPPDDRVQDMVVYGYHPYWEADPTDLPFDVLTHLAIFCVELDSDGSLLNTNRWTDVAGEVVPLAHSFGVKVHLTVISFDSDVQQAVLSSPTKRALAVSELAELVNAYGADGVNIDIEGMPSSLSDELVAFTAEINAVVDEVYLATPAVDWQGAYDYSNLAANSDGLFIMGYGYHWTGGNPGPNDPLYGGGAWGNYALDWTVDDYQTYGALPDDIVLGLPSYGQEWPADHDVPGSATGSGWSVEMWSAVAEASSTTAYFDDTTRSPYLLPSGTQLWYPTNDSIRERIAFAREQGLQGIGFWALGYEGDDPDFWPMVWQETSTSAPADTGDGGDTEADTDGPPNDTDTDPPKAQAKPGETAGCGCGGQSPIGPAALLAGLVLLRRHRSPRTP